MKVQVIIVTEQQRQFLLKEADASDAEAWLENNLKIPTLVDVFVREEGTEKESVWGLSPHGVNLIEREIEDVIVTEHEMNEE